MHKAVDFEIRGVSPLMSHNGQLADPLNVYTKRLKALQAKPGKKRTDADHAAIYDVEWEGSLYLNADLRPIIPGENIEGMLIRGAKRERVAPIWKAAIICDGEWLIQYDGPKDLGKLRADPRFRDIRGVRINSSRVMRCRPVFTPWSLKFTLHYLPDMLNESQVRDMLDLTGRSVGLGDFIPKYGRFTVVK